MDLLHGVENKAESLKKYLVDPIRSVPAREIEANCPIGKGKISWKDNKPTMTYADGDYIYINDKISDLKAQVSDCIGGEKCVVFEDKLFDVFTKDPEIAPKIVAMDKKKLECANILLEKFFDFAQIYQKERYFEKGIIAVRGRDRVAVNAHGVGGTTNAGPICGLITAAS